MPEVRGGSKRFGQPEGHPIDKQARKPGARGGGKDILEGDRSGRESGRPVQLEDDDDESQGVAPGRPGRTTEAERGLGGRPQEGQEGRKPFETDKTKR